jgi:phosphatidylglycerol---prolipoprotein diacylglyceryl transferase
MPDSFLIEQTWFVYPRLLQFGHIAIPTYGAFTALGLIAALTAAMHFAKRLALDANRVWNLGLIGILTILIGARLLLVIVYFSAFRSHPFWLLGLTNEPSPWIMAAAFVLGVAAAMLYAAAEDLPMLRMLDCLAPAAAIYFVINRAGAFVAGLDFGRPTMLPWSVTYTSRLAAFWYRTPLGLPLYPVQLYEAAASLAILAVLLWWLPRRRQDGEAAGAWLFLTGVASFVCSLYRGEIRSLAALETMAVLAVIVGGLLWIRRPALQRNA